MTLTASYEIDVRIAADGVRSYTVDVIGPDGALLWRSVRLRCPLDAAAMGRKLFGPDPLAVAWS